MEPTLETGQVGQNHRGGRSSSLRPSIAVDDHPIFNKYWVATPAVETFFNAVLQWVRLNMTGGVIFAVPQMGKTRAIEYTMDNLCKVLGRQIPMFLYSCPDFFKSVITENRFFSDLLAAVKHKLSESGTAPEKRRRFVGFLVERAIAAGSTKAVLFIDEAQQLNAAQYTWLMAVYNALDKEGIRLIVVLVGQPELEQRRDELLRTGENQIVNRFMAMITPFNGLSDVADFRETLKLYDYTAKYPEGSDWTYTRFFLPMAYESGLRLGKLADLCLQGFKDALHEHRLPKFKQLGMGDFTKFVQCLLSANMEADDYDFELTEVHIRDAIDFSGYVSRVGATRVRPRPKKPK